MSKDGAQKSTSSKTPYSIGVSCSYFRETDEWSAHHFLAGLLTGCLSASLLQPADLLKTRVQQSRSSSLLPTLKLILAQPNSVRSLWRGTLPSVIRTGVGSALYFSTLNALRTRAASNNLLTSNVPGSKPDGSLYAPSSSTSSTLPRLSTTANMTTGAIARAGAGLAMMPVTVIKVRYESNLYNYNSLASATRAIYATEGLRGFFSGFGATAARDAPYAGLYVVFYEEGKKRLAQLGDRTRGLVVTDGVDARELRLSGGEMETTKRKHAGGMGAGKAMTVNFVSGVMAAVAATAITNPFDAVKTRLQLMPGRYGNMVIAAQMMVREEGVRSLFDGLGLRVGRKAVSSALAWTGYEELVRRVETRIVG